MLSSSLLSTHANTKSQMAVRYHEMQYENFMSSFAGVASMSDNKIQGIFESVLGTMSKFENLAKCTKDKQMHEILASIFNFIQIILQSSLLYIYSVRVSTLLSKRRRSILPQAEVMSSRILHSFLKPPATIYG